MPCWVERSSRHRGLLILTPVLLAVSPACSLPPTSTQVIARVNGEEITRRDLWIEAQAHGVDPATVSQKDRRAYLDRIVERKVLAQVARDRELDRTPDYFAALRRNRELILAGLLARQESTRAQAPDDAGIDRYIAANPQKFAQREQLLVGSIVAPDAPADLLTGGGAPLTLDQVSARLEAAGIAYTRKREVIDTATLSPAAAARARSLKPGQALVVRDNGKLVAREVLNARRIDLGEASRDAARAMMRGEDEQAAAQRIMAANMSIAKIKYEPGWGDDAGPQAE